MVESSYLALAGQATRNPDAVALESAELSLTFLEGLTAVNQVSQVLLDQGVLPGDRVGVSTSLEFEWVVVLALDKIGAVSAVIRSMKQAEQLKALGFKYLATSLDLPEDGLPTLVKVALRHSEEPIADEPAHQWQPDEPHRIIFTSGTTGVSKAVEISFGQFMFRVQHARTGWLSSGPTLSLFGLDSALGPLLMMQNLQSGVPFLIVRDGVQAARFCQSWGIKTLHGSPVHLEKVLDEVDWSGCVIQRTIVTGAIPHPALAATIQLKIPGAETWVHYGSTEAGQTFFTEWEPGSKRLGNPMLPVSVSLSPIYDFDVSSGVLTIASPGIAIGYLVESDKKAMETFNGSFASGDLAYLEKNGEYSLIGRFDGVINIRGFKFAAESLETVLEERFSDTQVLVDMVDQKLLIQIESNKSPDRKRFLAEVKGFLGFDADIELEELESLPRNASGKKIRGTAK